MKKNLMTLVIAGAAILVGSSKTNAQLVSNSSSLKYQGNSIGEPDNISRKAIRDFAHTYENVTNEEWLQTKNGYTVRFISDGIRTDVFYDKKGKWVARIKYYGEEGLFGNIRHMVRSSYYDYAILGIQEIETIDSYGAPTYIINIEDKTRIKILRINAGNMEVWKEFDRAR